MQFNSILDEDVSILRRKPTKVRMSDLGISRWLSGMEKWNCHFDAGKKKEEVYFYNDHTLRLANSVNLETLNYKRRASVMKGQLSRTIVSSSIINFLNYAKPLHINVDKLWRICAVFSAILSKHQLEEVRKKEDQGLEYWWLFWNLKGL